MYNNWHVYCKSEKYASENLNVTSRVLKLLKLCSYRHMEYDIYDIVTVLDCWQINWYQSIWLVYFSANFEVIYIFSTLYPFPYMITFFENIIENVCIFEGVWGGWRKGGRTHIHFWASSVAVTNMINSWIIQFCM